MRTIIQCFCSGLIGIIVLGLALQAKFTPIESLEWTLVVAALVGIFGGVSGY